MDKLAASFFLLEFLGFSLYLIYMFRWNPSAWLPLLFLLLGVLAAAAYIVKCERRNGEPADV
jgi:hypothetical protein